MRVDLVPATEEHVAMIAANPREADVAELWASHRVTPTEAMHAGMKASKAVAGVVDGQAVCMFGITDHNLLLGQGVPWMIGSAAMESMTVKRELLRESRRFMAKARERYEVLFNAVDDRNEAAKRWLAWLGFTLLDPAPIGINGEAFRPFYWRA